MLFTRLASTIAPAEISAPSGRAVEAARAVLNPASAGSKPVYAMLMKKAVMAYAVSDNNRQYARYAASSKSGISRVYLWIDDTIRTQHTNVATKKISAGSPASL